ncbi:unnamed protein product [Prunus armeniaca]|uniref:Uncharacterized protein n=1 Tax=Prunus armeniaca TaxID=36596 RepID=A0A6J5X1U1_PRUAR|nr:unnamed protein product [Prunus armeniaca]
MKLKVERCYYFLGIADQVSVVIPMLQLKKTTKLGHIGILMSSSLRCMGFPFTNCRCCVKMHIGLLSELTDKLCRVSFEYPTLPHDKRNQCYFIFDW